MTSIIKIAGVSLAVCLLSVSAQSRVPVRSVNITSIDAPPRGAPGPIAGAGLPAVAMLGAYLWRQARRARAARRDPADNPA